jgi:hypothetical protein
VTYFAQTQVPERKSGDAINWEIAR